MSDLLFDDLQAVVSDTSQETGMGHLRSSNESFGGFTTAASSGFSPGDLLQ